MSSPRSTGRSFSADDIVAVQNSPVHAERGLDGVTPSTPGDLPGDRVSFDVARIDCAHRSRSESAMQHRNNSTEADKHGAGLGPCSSCAAAASAPSITGTSSGLRQSSDGDGLASMTQSLSVSAGPQPLRDSAIVARPTEVRTGITSGNASVTPSASAASSSAEAAQTALGTLQPGISSTAEDANFGSPQTNEDFNRALGEQPALSMDNLATISRGPTTDEQAPQRGLNPGAPTSVNHSNAFGLGRQLPATAAPGQPSAQQQTRSGTSTAYSARLYGPSPVVASMTSPFDRATWLQELHMEYLTSQYAMERGPFENAADTYAGYYLS